MVVDGPTPHVASPDTHVERHQRLVHNLTNHPPATEGVVKRFEEIREAAKLFGGKIIQLVPDNREKSLALTQLEQTVMWAIAGIARNQ